MGDAAVWFGLGLFGDYDIEGYPSPLTLLTLRDPSRGDTKTCQIYLGQNVESKVSVLSLL